MLELMKKSLFAGLGAIAVTEETIQHVVDDFVQKEKLTKQEGEIMARELRSTLEEQKQKLTAMIDERMTSLMEELNLASKSDLEATEATLKETFADFETRLHTLEQQVNASQSDTSSSS